MFQSDVPSLDDAASAYRAILTQILHNHQHDRTVIDKLVFATSNNATGQTTASSNDLVNLMSMIMYSIDGGSLVPDGIDECTDVVFLIDSLTDIIRDCSVNLLIFS